MDLQSVQALIIGSIMSDPLIPALLLLTVLALVRTVMLSRRITFLAQGGDGKSLESAIRNTESRLRRIEEHAQKTELALNNLDERLQRAVRGVATRRFDPFQNAGGQQSFATALIDEHGDGVVLSGIHARDGVRVYAKEVREFTSERELSEDEQHALGDAKKRLQ